MILREIKPDWFILKSGGLAFFGRNENAVRQRASARLGSWVLAPSAPDTYICAICAVCGANATGEYETFDGDPLCNTCAEADADADG